MFEPKIKISKALHEKLQVVAEEKGYSSVEEFAVHVLEEAVSEVAESLSDEEVRKRLEGLGYLG